MKHQQCVYMPSTVEDWLREQLVKRGIDAVLFTQYILNLLQSVFLNQSGVLLNSFEQNGLEMLVSELCVNLIDAVKKCEVVTPFLKPDQCISDSIRDLDMCGPGSKGRICEDMSVLQDSKMELDLQAILGEDEVGVPYNKGPRSRQKCRRDLYLAFTQSLSQEEQKQVCTIPLEYNAYNDLRVPRVDAMEHDVNQDTVCHYNDKLIEVSSDDGSPKTEDRNLARLIAKFDSSIEALWNPEESLNFTETCEEFQELDPSPVPMDIPNKQSSFSFLPYGTDICSIWSSQPSPEELVLKSFTSVEPICKNEASVWNLAEEEKEISKDDVSNDSLAALNHSKEGSSFTEVKPRAQKKNLKAFTMETLLEPQISPQESPNSKMEPMEKRRKEKEEDLLVSQSTHFSPIRKEARTTSKRQNEPIRYEDGTTFAIPNTLERLNFTRSASGALYLDQEGASPTKFMEFREGGGVHTFGKDFIPKFRVKQNEKCCQTDREDLEESCSPECCSEQSATWAKVKMDRLDVTCPKGVIFDLGAKEKGCDLEEEVEEEVRKTIEGRTKKKDACFKCGNPPSWVSDWISEPVLTAATAAATAVHSGIWQGAFTLMTLEPASQRGYPAWSEADGSNGLCWECVANAENHKSQLRQELIQEGEQLLTDLNLNSLYLLDENPEKVADYAAPCTKSPKEEADWTVATAQRERKRRLCSSQRACSLYMEDNCRRPHCRFSHDLSAVPCRFWGDASCLKGEKCPFLHSNLHALLRPVTL